MRAPAIGIDLGTENSCVGVFQNGKVEIIKNDFGERTTPSYVAFTDSGRLIGNAAKNQIQRNPTNTIFNAKRLIGRKFEDSEIQKEMEFWPFKIVKDTKSDRPQYKITYQNKEKKFYAEVILSMILQKLKQTASDFLGKEVKEAIITVPAYFNDSQRQSIKDAGTISGLYVLRIINDSTAAGIAYGFDNKSEKERNILIFDLGAFNFNVSLLGLEDGLFEVKATSGTTLLGGEYFNNRLVEYCIGEFRKKTGIDIKNNTKALMRVRKCCEKAKRALSYTTQIMIDIDCLIDEEDLNIIITRTKFEDLCMDLFKKCFPILENVLKDARYSKSQIDEIILVGGSTRIPKIQQMVQEFFNGKEPNININPDEAVAYGAAVQAAIMTNRKDENIEKLILLDVIPLSLGIETEGGVMNVIIPRNSIIPVKKTQIISTHEDNQNSMIIKIFEGEGHLTKDNYELGKLVLDGIPAMPKGQPQIEVTIDIDANLIINVMVVEKSTGKHNKIIITNDKERLSKDDIDMFVKEAEKFKDEDNEEKERIKAKNILEEYCNQIKQTINDTKLKDKFSKDDKDLIERKINEIFEQIYNHSNASKEEYDCKVREIELIFNPIMQKIYQQEGGIPYGMPNFGNHNFSCVATGGAEDVE